MSDTTAVDRDKAEQWSATAPHMLTRKECYLAGLAAGRAENINPDYRRGTQCDCTWIAAHHGDICPEHGTPGINAIRNTQGEGR